jgi:hypothetical protein
MCRTAPNQDDKNPCANLCPEINEGLTKNINFDGSEAKKRRLRGGKRNFWRRSWDRFQAKSVEEPTPSLRRLTWRSGLGQNLRPDAEPH